MAKCAVPDCTIMVPNEHLMCLPHWKLVSRETQRDVHSSWRRIYRDPTSYQEAKSEAVAEVQRAEERGPNSRQGSFL